MKPQKRCQNVLKFKTAKSSTVFELLYVESCSHRTHAKVNKIMTSYTKLVQN